MRETCLRCRRPSTFCYCALLPDLKTKAAVLFLQHPRERDVAIGTARMAHLSLVGSRLLQGVGFDDHPVVAQAVRSGDAALLFPGEGAVPVQDCVGRPPSTLVVVDGTWWQAKQVLALSPTVAALPRMSLAPQRPSTYRIRREPTDQHLSTVEAVALTLGILEGDPRRFARMLAPFDFMVERQLVARELHVPRQRKVTRPFYRGLGELGPLVRAPQRAVLIHGEDNAQSRPDRDPGSSELVHLVALRPATGERFEAVLRPRRRLGARVAERLGLAAGDLLHGEEMPAFLARWRDFLGSDALLLGWGRHGRELLLAESVAPLEFIDLRSLTVRTLRRSAGGVEGGARRLGGLEPGRQAQRAARLLGSLEGIYGALMARAGA